MQSKYSQTLERRGTKRHYYLEYFLALGGRLIDTQRLAGPDWIVVLSEEFEIGQLIKLPVVHITFEGEYERVQEMIRAFRLKFLSAGG